MPAAKLRDRRVIRSTGPRPGWTGGLASEAIRRLMTVPGVSLMTAATFIAAVGDIRRFDEPGRLVGYLGLDPKVRQSGIGAARHGRISKQGASQVRQMLTEAAFVAVSTPGPMRAVYDRVRARRGSQIAIVAVARKLAVLFWHLLTREQDYAYIRLSTERKRQGHRDHVGGHGYMVAEIAAQLTVAHAAEGLG